MNKTNEPQEIQKIKTMSELRTHLLDWISQCNIKITNMQVEIARRVKERNWIAAERDLNITRFYDRELTIANYLNSMIEVGEIELATTEDLKNLKNGKVM